MCVCVYEFMCLSASYVHIHATDETPTHHHSLICRGYYVPLKPFKEFIELDFVIE